MSKLRAAVLDPAVHSLSHGPLSLAVLEDGTKRFVEVTVKDAEEASEEAQAVANQVEVGFRALVAYHQLGEPELVPDKPKPAAKAETVEKE